MIRVIEMFLQLSWIQRVMIQMTERYIINGDFFSFQISCIFRISDPGIQTNRNLLS